MRSRKRARLAVGILTAVLLAGSTSGPVGAGPVQKLAKVEGRVLQAARQTGRSGTLDLMVSLDRVASPLMRARLARLGTWSWAFEHIPVAAVRLPIGKLGDLRRLDGVRGVYLNRKLDYALKDSAERMSTGRAWTKHKVTGKGVTVAILDSGVDFTHPDLAPAMKANVKLVEYGTPTPVVPIEGIPNSDTTSGHGTHVAGDVAGRGIASDGAFKGMGYGADLVGIGAGDVLFIFTVIEGFDYVIEKKDEFGIRAVNNSWGTEFESFDPDNPINVATKAVHDAGVVVLFSMGNSYDEMTISPYAAAPWVIPVAAGTKTGSVTDFTSGGIEADIPSLPFDGKPRPGARGPLAMGLYHPSVTSTGENVVSTRANNTVLPLTAIDQDIMLEPGQIPYYTTFSGTSMASPETAGVVAMILEANPSLTPDQVRQVLEVTARPIKDVPFWKQGYGYTDASAAVELALSLRRTATSSARAAAGDILTALRAKVDAARLADTKPAKTVWSWKETIGTATASVDQAISVPAGTDRVKIVANGPSTIEVNVVSYDIVLTDASGTEVAASLNTPIPQSIASGTTALDVNLHQLGATAPESSQRYSTLKWGTWNVNVSTVTSAAPPVPGLQIEDIPKTELDVVASIFEDLPVACGPTSVFAPAGTTVYRFQDDDASGAPYPANPSYTYVGPIPNGTLGTRTLARNLAATFGLLTEVPGPRVRFQTAPFAKDVTVGRGAVVETWIQTPIEAARGLLGAELIDISPNGSVETVATMPGAVGAEGGTAAPAQTKAAIPLSKPYTFKAGHSLAVDLGVTFIGTIADTLFYDSDEFPSGLTIVTGNVVTKDLCAGAADVKGSKVARGGTARGERDGAALPATGLPDGTFALLGLLSLAAAAGIGRALMRRV